LILVTAAVFAPVVRHDFVDWDDDLLVWENPDLKPLTLERLGGFWRALNPLTTTVYALLAQLPPGAPGSSVSATLDPRVFHAANLVLHALSVLVVFRLLGLLVGHAGAAGAGALLFGLHPVQVEAVAWVTGLRDVLSGLLALVALWQYVLWAGGGASAPRRRIRYGVATLSFVMAFLAKPTAVAVPLMAAVLDRWMLGRTLRQSAVALGGWLVAAVAWGLLAKAYQADASLAYVTPPWGRPVVAADAIVFYLRTLLLPVGLGPDYGRTPASVLAAGARHHALLVASAVAFALLLWRLRRPWLLAAAGLFLAGLLPVLGLVGFLFQLWSTVADRYLYLPLLGVALAVAHGLARARRPVVAAAAVLGLGLLGVLSARQVRHWQNSHTLFAHALAVNPRSWTAHHNWGVALRREGRLEEAIEHFAAAARLKPDLEWAHEFLADGLMRTGRTDEAIAHWVETLRTTPDSALARHGLALALARQGRRQEAIVQYRRALALRPEWTEVHYHLANALAAEGRSEEAIAHYREALRLRPDLAEAHSNLGVALAAIGRTDEAIREYREALRTVPDLAPAHLNLANALLQLGRPADAVTHYRAALDARPDDPAAQRGLARALAALGRQ
jgi:tetratricopeptide (TPR) repeat protein